MKLKIPSLLVGAFIIIVFTVFIPSLSSAEEKTVDKYYQTDRDAHPEQDEGENRLLPLEDEVATETVWSLMLKTGLSLALVVFLLFGLVKVLNMRNSSFPASRFMSVKAGINLGQNKTLKLVKVGDTYFLLGVGEDVQLIKEFTAKDDLAQFEQWLDTHQSPQETLFRKLKDLLLKRNREQRSDKLHSSHAYQENGFQHELETQMNQFIEKRKEINQILDDEESTKGRGE